jgi:hypothetical protein
VAGNILKVEVKGLSGTRVDAELTSNEYKTMLNRAHREQYVVYIVTMAGMPGEKAHVFRYDHELSSSKMQVWCNDEGRRLVCTEVIAARLSVE